ncbi:MAG: transcriptional regulator, partial [Candidatus Bathyarchaeia archaeon]
MSRDQIMGWLILLGSIVGIIVYFYLAFLSPWAMLTIQLSAFLAVAAVLVIVAWIGYTLATTPMPTPIEDLGGFEEDIVEEEEEEEEEVSPQEKET